MKGWGRFGFILTGLLLLIPLFGVAATGPEIGLSTTMIRPGDFLQIKVTAPHESLVRVVFTGSSKTLPEGDDETFYGLVAASYYTTPDVYPLGIEITKDQKVVTSLYQIQVIERKFPESRVTMNEEKRKTIMTKANEESDIKKTQEVRSKALLEAKPPLWSAPFIWPVKGTVTTDFGFIRYVNNIENGRHSGIDIGALSGTPVMACNNGIVVFSGNLYQTGFTIIIYHGLDLYTAYGHLSMLKAQADQRVVKGDTVGLVGSTGLSTGPHLHLTFRIGEIPVDPALFLEKEVGWEF
jgi:murein DD-endopeptidase MepM/ murein hydrolase activator NlpD